MRAFAVPLMLLGGALVAVQSQLNSRLADGLGDGLRAGALAAIISFGSGFLLLSIAVLVTRQGRTGVGRLVTALRTRRLRWYEILGGLAGAFFVASQGLAIGTLGIALFIVAFTAGQAGGSLAVDHLGLSPSGRHAPSLSRLVAAVLAVIAVLLKAGEQLDVEAGGVLIAFTAAAVVAGLLQSVQQAFNGRVSAAAGSLATTWNNFTVGTAALLALLAVSFVRPGAITALPRQPWLYLGGCCGIVVIYIASSTVQAYGVLVLGLCTIAGQVLTAEVIEVLTSEEPVGIVGLAGGALTLLGVVIALLLRPDRSSHI